MEKSITGSGSASAFSDAAWFDPLEEVLRGRIREFIEDLVEEEATAVLGRDRWSRPSTWWKLGCG